MTADEGSPEVVVVSGLSGAGRTTAAKCLEDLGYFVVDNLPPSLIAAMVDLARRPARSPGSRWWSTCAAARSRRPAQRDRGAGRAGLPAARAVPRGRRRRAGPPVREHTAGRTRCRAAAGWSTASPPSGSCWRSCTPWPTWSSTPPPVRARPARRGSRRVRARGARRRCGRPCSRSASSTGCRWTPTSSSTCGSCPTRTGSRSCASTPARTAPSATTCSARRAPTEFLDRYVELLRLIAAGYQREGKRYLTLAVGCTGGKHRSVAMAEETRRAGWPATGVAGSTGRAPGPGARVTGERRRGQPPGRWRSAAGTGCPRRCRRCAGSTARHHRGGHRRRRRRLVRPAAPRARRAAAGRPADGAGRAGRRRRPGPHLGRVLQHRFGGARRAGRSPGRQPAARRPDGAARRSGAALDMVGRAARRARPGAADGARPLDIVAEVTALDEPTRTRSHRIRGQVAVATTPGRVGRCRWSRRTPPACPEAVAAIAAADVVVLGPGLLVHQRAAAPAGARAGRGAGRHRRRGSSCSTWPRSRARPPASPRSSTWRCCAAHAPDLRVDVGVADTDAVADARRSGRRRRRAARCAAGARPDRRSATARARPRSGRAGVPGAGRRSQHDDLVAAGRRQ